MAIDVARNGKYWRQREKELMTQLGLKPVPLSGAGWVEKEDGESETILAQLKSTEGQSITVNKQDVLDLFYHSRVAHKLPLFILDFGGDFQLFLIRPDELKQIAEARDEDSI